MVSVVLALMLVVVHGFRHVKKSTNDKADADVPALVDGPEKDDSFGGETLLLQVHPDAPVFKQSQARIEVTPNVSVAPSEQLTGHGLEDVGAASGDLKSQAQGSHGCASRLNSWVKRNAACLITSGGKALLVYVPYGSNHGWDFPGGQKHEHEFACQTAEREACEETGYKVQAVRKLTYNVFECNIVAENVCRKPVDEGFLKKRWVSRDQIHSVHYRGGTWGNKAAILAGHL